MVDTAQGRYYERMKKTFAKIFLVFAAIMVTGYVITTTVSAASFFGAIYTTDNTGTGVDLNIYPDKESVYLNGGPQNQNGRGLPDGTYYFQVTDPSGHVLLSSDAAECRQALVVLGKMAGPTGPACQHAAALANDANGSLGVQLAPFDTTPNAGGEYKVWLIRQTDSTSVDSVDNKVIHFKDNDSKTDNFKVNIECPDPCGPPPPPPPDTFSIGGSKFFDVNANGVFDVGQDFPLGGFLIRSELDPALISGNPVNRLTLADGTWSISGIPNLTDFWTYEIIPNACNAPAGSFWQQTLPTATGLITPPSLDPTQVRGYAGTIEGLDVTHLDFGNRCIRNGSGGLTIGFWSNKNGQALETSADFTALNGYNLRNANGSDRDFTGTLTQMKSSYNSWLLSANATNMAYMLSAQMSATYLNVAHAKIDGTALLDVGGQIGTINGWITEANTSLGSYPNTTSPHAQRANQERLKNIFDAINNNNFLFIQTGCTACYPQ